MEKTLEEIKKCIKNRFPQTTRADSAIIQINVIGKKDIVIVVLKGLVSKILCIADLYKEKGTKDATVLLPIETVLLWGKKHSSNKLRNVYIL
jgi:hypothetical protein